MKGKSIIFTTIIFVLSQILTWILRPIWFFKWEIQTFGFSFIGGLINIIITLLLIYFSNHNFKSYGFKQEGWKFSLDIGLQSWIFLFIPIIFLLLFSLDYRNTLDSIFLGILYISSLFFFLFLIKGKMNESSDYKTNLLIYVGILVFPLILAIFIAGSELIIGRVISTILYQVIFSGFGEEMRYRGYFQSKINQEFDKPYSLFKVTFGPGLILASLFFATSHLLNSFSPFEGIFILEWGWGIYSLFLGIFFGFIKEKTENIIGPGISHSFDAFGQSLILLFG